MDNVEFLRSTPPFDALPAARFEDAARHLEERRYPAGTWLARAGGEPMRRLYLIRRGSVRLERNGQTVQVLEEGETFGYTSLITGRATLDVVVEEDLVACELPADEFQRLEQDPRFAAHFAAGLGERLRASLEQSPVAAFQLDVALAPAEEKCFVFLLGYVENPPERKWSAPGVADKSRAHAMQERFDSADKVQAAFAALKAR